MFLYSQVGTWIDTSWVHVVLVCVPWQNPEDMELWGSDGAPAPVSGVMQVGNHERAEDRSVGPPCRFVAACVVGSARST